jgi:hypothetical protein
MGEAMAGGFIPPSAKAWHLARAHIVISRFVDMIFLARRWVAVKVGPFDVLFQFPESREGREIRPQLALR